jgi:hypothetical protein
MMIGTLTLAAALATPLGQAGPLNLTQVRTTYGELGAPRTETRYLPGDYVFVAFDIEGLTVDAEGKVAYSMTMEVIDKANKPVFKQDKPAESEQLLPLGGSRLPARAFVSLRPDQEAGTYVCRVSVTDKASKVTKTLEKPFEVVPKTFGIIGLYTTSDMKGERSSSPTGVVGQDLYVHFAVIGISRGPDKKPNALAELRIYDDQKRPTLAKPMSAVVPRELPEDEPAIFRFVIPFNREGSFTAEFKAIDNVSGKNSTVSFPIRVIGR